MGLLLLMGDSGARPLLDSYTAAVGYSLRKLRTAYSGSAVRVRRSSDNAEQDIGFASGRLDTASLLSFCGVGNGFVTTWYDQVGSTNATQTTAGSQPQIVDTGSLIVSEFSKPAIRIVDINAGAIGPFLELSPWYANTQSYVGIFSAYSMTANGSFPQFINGNPSDRGLLLLHFDTTREFRIATIRTTTQVANGSVMALNTTAVRHDYADRTRVKTFLNTTAAADIDIADGNTDFNMPTTIRIGSANSVGNQQSFLISEHIGFTADQTANELTIRRNISNYWRV